jgi:hypothetical protein
VEEFLKKRLLKKQPRQRRKLPLRKKPRERSKKKLLLRNKPRRKKRQKLSEIW